jgi:hypothetical protein
LMAFNDGGSRQRGSDNLTQKKHNAALPPTEQSH